jgi:hypothetical protein
MTESGTEMNNRIAKEAVSIIIKGVGGDEVEAMIVVESVVFGFLSVTRPNPSEAVVFLDVMTERIVTRLYDASLNRENGGDDAQ